MLRWPTMIELPKLSDKEREVLACVDLGARQTPSEIARQTGMRIHSVRYALDALKSRLGLVPYCWPHPYKLGMIPYRIFCNIATAKDGERRAFLQWLRACPTVTWLGEFSGLFHYGIAVQTPSIDDLKDFLEQIDDRFGELRVRKTISVLTQLSFLRMKFMSRRKFSPELLEYRSTNQRYAFDDKDRTLLEALRANPLHSTRELAQQTGLPASTIAYRLAAFEKENLILGYFYQFDHAMLGLQSYLLLISAGGVGGHIYDQLRKFALTHPHVVMFGHCIGSWDFELQLLIQHPKQLVEVEQAIHNLCGGAVNEISSLNWISDLKG